MALREIVSKTGRVSSIMGCFATLAFTGSVALAQGNYALSFDGTNQYGDSTVNPFTDNLWMDVWVNWHGPTRNTSPDGGQTVVYNGHSACTGWGIFLRYDGRVAVLVGGIDVADTNAQVALDTWHQIRVSRINGVFSVELDGIEYPLSSNPAPRAIGTCPFGAPSEALLVGNGSGVLDKPGSSPGDAFFGVADSVRIKGVGKPPKAGMTFWHLDEGMGTTATDIRGATLTLHNNPAWVPGHGR